MKYLLLTSMLALLSYGCSSQNKAKDAQQEKRKNREIRMVLRDSIVNHFPYDKERNYTAIYPIQYKGANWLLQGNTRSGYTALTGISKRNKNKNKHILLDVFRKIKEEYHIQCFEYVNADSIWAVSIDRATIYLLNLEGTVNKVIPFKAELNGEKIDLIARMRGWPFAYNAQRQ